MSVVTFVVTPVIFRTQGPGSAGKIVGALFPVYFRFCLVVTAAALVARAASGRAFTGARQLAGTFLVVFCLGIVSYHTFGLAPRMAIVRETVVSLEAAPQEDPARLHGISMTLNLVVILAGTILVLWYETFRR